MDDQMCEWGPTRLVQCGGIAGLCRGWAQGNTGRKSVLAKSPASRLFIVWSICDIMYIVFIDSLLYTIYIYIYIYIYFFLNQLPVYQ